jgi:lysyl-tRNA synthetase class 2
MKMTDQNNNRNQQDSNLHFDTAKLNKLTTLRADGINPFQYTFSRSCQISEISPQLNEITHEPSSLQFTIAGRIFQLRYMGKSIFADLRDESGKIQLYFRKDTLGLEKFSFIKKNIDMGDIIGISGRVFKTKMGEITLWVETLELLTKALNNFPEKYHGLVEVEKRYRERYLDLIMNGEARRIFQIRSHLIFQLRKYLVDRNYLEVETPYLQPVYGGANARPFRTFHNALDQDLFLRIAPEIYLKKIAIGGFEKIFEIGKNFRNEDIDSTHNPEFTTIEIYEAYKDFQDMMDLTETLIRHVAQFIHKESLNIEYNGNFIDYSAKFRRMTMIDAVNKFAQIPVMTLSIEELAEIAKKHNLDDFHSFSNPRQYLILFFEHLVESQLIQPTFIYDFPLENSPLAKKHRSQEGFTERFELFINGRELANGFSELNDPIDQKERFNQQDAQRDTNDEAMMNDYDYINALGYGLPPTGGVGIGIDRLVMFLTKALSIKEVIFFPQMRQLN